MMQVSTPLNPSRAGDDALAKNRPVFPTGQMLPFVLVTFAFFLWGMSNNLTDILVQQFKKSFELSLFQAQLVQTANFLAYGTMAIPAALLTRRFGYRAGILTGCACSRWVRCCSGLLLSSAGMHRFWSRCLPWAGGYRSSRRRATRSSRSLAILRRRNDG